MQIRARDTSISAPSNADEPGVISISSDDQPHGLFLILLTRGSPKPEIYTLPSSGVTRAPSVRCKIEERLPERGSVSQHDERLLTPHARLSHSDVDEGHVGIRILPLRGDLCSSFGQEEPACSASPRLTQHRMRYSKDPRNRFSTYMPLTCFQKSTEVRYVQSLTYLPFFCSKCTKVHLKGFTCIGHPAAAGGVA